MNAQLTQDPENNLAYIRFSNNSILKTVPVSDEINIDLGAHDEVIGIEYLDLGAKFPQSLNSLLQAEITLAMSEAITIAESNFAL